MSGIPDTLELKLIENTEDVEEFLRWLSADAQREVLGFDTETTGFSPEKDKIRLMQFGDKQMGWAMSWRDWRGLAKQVFDRYDKPYVAHNSKFDIRFLCHDFGWSVQDWPWHRTHDAMGMAHIADSQRLKGLKPLSDRLVDPRASSGQKTLHDGMEKNKWTWATVPIEYPPYWQYGALDPVLTVFIYDKLKDQMIPDLYDMEMGAVRVAAKMEETGMRISRAYATDKSIELETASAQIRQYLGDRWGLEDPTPMQLLKFFEREGVTLMEKHTKGGQQSMDKHVLQTTDHEVAKYILALRKAEKITGTYLRNFLRFAGADDIIHPNINTMAARTGRMSITDPALQTLPRKDPIVRDAVIPREGNSLLTIDADQIEARLTAHFSKDPGLIAAFNDPGDFFCNIATGAFGHEVTKGMKERDLIKGVVYGKVYGASVVKMAETAGVPISQMDLTNAAFDTNYPGVRTFMREVTAEGRRRAAGDGGGRGYVVTPYGRKLKSDRGKEYTLVNYLIQCHASEVLKRKIVELDAVLPEEAMMILPVHDEIIFDIPNEMVHDVQRLAEEVLNESSGYEVPITWSGDIMAGSWGEKYRK